jgi:ubiquinone/menaquinone biosynthesis C-methylase UbiE
MRVDPEENEIHALLNLAGSMVGKRVLEVGCGDGRLTWRYAAEAGHITALDPKADKLERARADCPASLRERIDFVALDLEEFAAGIHTEQYDLAILAWSL